MRNKFIYLLFSFFVFLSACSNDKNNTYQGYAEGRFTYVSTNFPGKLETLSVNRGDSVKPQDPLFILEQEPEQSLYEKTKADLALAKITFERQKNLLKQHATSQEAYDQAKSVLNKLQVELKQMQWQIQQKTIFAPKAGKVFDTYFLPGEWVGAGQPVLSLLAPNDIKIIFFVKEPMLSQLKINQTISLRCDGCSKDQRAKINFISPTAEYTPPIIYSDERRTKLVYRIEAMPDQPSDFHPGQPVKVHVEPNA